jgi:hypothetical protein
MSPDERQLLVDLFDRIRQNANNPRDREAEAFIADQVRAQPYAPYLLAQTVIVQDQALRAANDRLQQLEQHIRELESEGGRQQGSGGFLGGLGSLFGGGADRGPPPSSVPPTRWGGPQGGAPAYGPGGGYAQQGGYGQPQGGYGQPQGGPWSTGAPYQQGGGGGFLKGALGAAAGVAGGVLLADSIRGLFHGAGNPLGIGSGFGGAGAGGLGGGDTVVNNYYEGGDSPSQAADFGPDQNDGADVLDAASSDDLSGGGDTLDV